MKLTIGTALVMGSVAISAWSVAASRFYRNKCVELKMDNIELLKNTFKLIEHVDIQDVPEEIIIDIQFRRTALLTEFEGIRKER